MSIDELLKKYGWVTDSENQTYFMNVNCDVVVSPNKDTITFKVNRFINTTVVKQFIDELEKENIRMVVFEEEEETLYLNPIYLPVSEKETEIKNIFHRLYYQQTLFNHKTVGRHFSEEFVYDLTHNEFVFRNEEKEVARIKRDVMIEIGEWINHRAVMRRVFGNDLQFGTFGAGEVQTGGMTCPFTCHFIAETHHLYFFLRFKGGAGNIVVKLTNEGFTDYKIQDVVAKFHNEIIDVYRTSELLGD